MLFWAAVLLRSLFKDHASIKTSFYRWYRIKKWQQRKLFYKNSPLLFIPESIIESCAITIHPLALLLLLIFWLLLLYPDVCCQSLMKEKSTVNSRTTINRFRSIKKSHMFIIKNIITNRTTQTITACRRNIHFQALKHKHNIVHTDASTTHSFSQVSISLYMWRDSYRIFITQCEPPSCIIYM